MKSGDSFKIGAYSRLIIKIFKKESNDLIPLTTDRINIIKQAISSLSYRERKIINLHWRLKDKRIFTLEAIGKELGVTKERIRIIEKRAFRKLRSITRLGKEIFFYSDLIRRVYGLEEIAQENEELKRRIKIMEELLPSPEKQKLLELQEKYLGEELELKWILDKSVSEFEFPVRVHNSFKNAGIKTIRELVYKTESELLGKKGFGPKSVADIKEILAENGLYLGMFFRK